MNQDTFDQDHPIPDTDLIDVKTVKKGGGGLALDHRVADGRR